MSEIIIQITLSTYDMHYNPRSSFPYFSSSRGRRLSTKDTLASSI